MLTWGRKRLRIQATQRARRRFWEHHDRPDYECPMCGYEAQGIDGEFEVHHIDGDWLNNHVFNLVAICHHCHVRVHRIRNWTRDLGEWQERVDELGADEMLPTIEPAPVAVTDGGEEE